MNTYTKTIILFLILCFTRSGNGFAQTHYIVHIKDIHCAVETDILNKPPNESLDIVGYEPDASVLKIWNDILTSTKVLAYSSFITNITLKEAKIQNCYSTHEGNKFLLFYDRDFFYQFKDDDIDINTLIMFALAHELGHFINHDDIKTKSKENEINADKFACGILCNLHIKQKAAHDAIMALAGTNNGSYYPGKGDRLKNINLFYQQNSCGDNSVPEKKNELPTNAKAECEVKNIGDYCYVNSTNKKNQILFSQGFGSAGSIIVGAGQTQCNYNIPAGIYDYAVTLETNNVSGQGFFPVGMEYLKGQIRVEPCKSLTLNIR